jgi:hypothetical protein
LESSCWQDLFESCTLVHCNPVPQHNFGKGTEASLILFLSLVAVKFYCIIDGGVVFVGYRMLIYPTAVENDCAQFHLLTCNLGQIDPYKAGYEEILLKEDSNRFETNAMNSRYSH